MVPFYFLFDFIFWFLYKIDDYSNVQIETTIKKKKKKLNGYFSLYLSILSSDLNDLSG